jgi:hypothetical protein
VFSAADLIEALSARVRRRFPLQSERAFGEFPPTWRAWFLAIQERAGVVTGVPAADYVKILAARTPRQVPRASAELGRWQSYRHLLRQQWGAAPADQRRTRRIGAAVSALMHLCLIPLLLWVGMVRVGDAPPDTQQAGEAIQVEFIGEGTPVDEGGAPAPGQADAPASAGAGQPASAGGGQQAAAAPPPPPFVAAAPPDADDTPPQPSPPAEAASAQPLAVTETATPDPEFTLPQTAAREIALPSLRPQTPSLSTQVVEVETVAEPMPTPTLRAPTPRPVAPTVPALRTQVVEIETFQPTVPVPTLQAPAPRTAQPKVPTLRAQVTEIEVHSPLSPVTANGLAQTPSTTPRLRPQELRTAPGEIALKPGVPGGATSTSSSSASSRTPGNQASSGAAPTPSTTPGAASAGGRPQAQGAGRTAGTAPSGAGTRPSTRPGAATSTVRDDDWGASNRNVPGNSNAGNGNTAGLFNSDGSVRLPGGAGDVGGGLPPGTIIEDFEKIDRMGTWLKRPPLDYTPTRFDRFWIPNKTLLEEWVSRGIKTVAIPIPGTTKRIECTVSLLSVGGSCRVTDPNLRDQEAIARPPPDVPYKPELREDKDGPSAPPATP